MGCKRVNTSVTGCRFHFYERFRQVTNENMAAFLGGGGGGGGGGLTHFSPLLAQKQRVIALDEIMTLLLSTGGIFLYGHTLPRIEKTMKI